MATYAHIAIGIATIIGWEHLDLIWPRSVLPQGLPLWGEQRMTGLLTIGDRGRPARLASSSGLLEDWRVWIQNDQRQESDECVAISEATRAKLLTVEQARPRSAGVVQYWVELRGRYRLGPALCRQEGGLHIAHSIESIEAIRPVACSRDVFVAHGFVCPTERRSNFRESETFKDIADYYPEEAARAESEGSTQVRVQRDETGSPVECSILQSSGSDALDRQTCKLVGVDPRFTSGKKGSAGKVGSPVTQRITWRLERDESEAVVER